METLRKLLGPDRADEIASRVSDAIRRAYTDNLERHHADHGDDNLTYSVLVWRNSWFNIEIALAGLPGVAVSRPAGSLQILVDGFVIHVWKAGSSWSDVQAARFDRGLVRMGTASANTAQLSIFDELGSVGSDEDFVRTLKHIVIAHCGSPEDGCRGVFAGAPVEVGVDGSQWRWLESLDSAVPLTLIAPERPDATEFHPVAEPDLGLKLRHKPEADEQETR
jgi:hypothetical protein